MELFAVVDVETTGGKDSRITEIGIVVHDGYRVMESFHSLVNPQCRIEPFVRNLTGITDSMVENAPLFADIAHEVDRLTAGKIFVAHAVNFDYSILRKEFGLIGLEFKRNRICTIRLSRQAFPHISSFNLPNLCSALNIDHRERHRALGDAIAASKVLEQVFIIDDGKLVRSFLQKTSGEFVLPPTLNKDIYQNLPESSGVYYFHDRYGKIIYVGKAINIKKRVRSHFESASQKWDFVSSIHNITYDSCGTELIALLLESHQIQKLWPHFNQAQKFNHNGLVLTSYYDQKGILRLLFTRDHRNLKSYRWFRNFDEARSFMNVFASENNLCLKYCGVQRMDGPCRFHEENICGGICNSTEAFAVYNSKVEKALEKLDRTLENKLIFGKGRSRNEKSVVVIEKGEYKGFGYFPAKRKRLSFREAFSVIQPYKHTADIGRILLQHLNESD